mmetsp:Transcript_7592/g.11273  ORF Transcript_7592/g.11273 Transcript_7592/m.11273 type:complete len:246 (-) Transcript_7592:1129-1866(-)
MVNIKIDRKQFLKKVKEIRKQQKELGTSHHQQTLYKDSSTSKKRLFVSTTPSQTYQQLSAKYDQPIHFSSPPKKHPKKKDDSPVFLPASKELLVELDRAAERSASPRLSCFEDHSPSQGSCRRLSMLNNTTYQPRAKRSKKQVLTPRQSTVPLSPLSQNRRRSMSAAKWEVNTEAHHLSKIRHSTTKKKPTTRLSSCFHRRLSFAPPSNSSSKSSTDAPPRHARSPSSTHRIPRRQSLYRPSSLR